MSKKNQNNDGRDESLSDEQNDISNSDEVIKNSPEDTIESVEEIEEIYEEIADEENIDQDHDQNEDQGFDERPVAAHTDGGTGGGGMAKTAMGLSMLALAGTGYNLYDSNSSDSAGTGESPQAAVDYSSDIATIQEQIESLMQSQEELTAMATATQADSDSGSDVATDDTDQFAATEENTNAVAEESQAADEGMMQADSSEAMDETTVEATTLVESPETTPETTDETTDEAIAQAESSGTEQETDSQTAETETSAESAASSEVEEQAAAETVADEPVQEADEDSVVVDSDAAASDTASMQADSESEQLAETDTVSDQDDQSVSATSNQADLELTRQQIQQAQVEALAAIPSGDDIKKLAQQQVNVVLDDAKKRLGLNEVAQLLSIAEQRLTLASDIAGAQAAFGIADQRLSEISDPAVEPVRESISSNLAALESIEVVDKNALTQELTTMAGSIDSLAFKPLETLSATNEGEQAQADQGSDEQADSEQAQTQESSPADEELSLEGAGQWLKSLGSKVGDTIGNVGSGIAGDLKGMVTIQKTGALNDMVLAPEQQYFIRENIKLQLGSAQRAVLQDNTGVFKQSLAQAGAFLTDYFDTEDEDVKSVSARLVELEDINLELDVPDVSAASMSLADVIKQLPSVGSSETNSN